MFRENLNAVRGQFSSAMDLDAGRNLKVKDVFQAIEELESGKYNTLKQMYENSNFNSQNKVYQAVTKMLENMGTPINDLTTKNKKNKLAGTDFALAVLEQNGITLPEKKVKEKEDSVSL